MRNREELLPFFDDVHRGGSDPRASCLSMFVMRALLLLLLLANTGCHPTIRKTMFATASTGLIGVDWIYTATEVVPHCKEVNPVIGRCGDRVPVNVYFPVAMIVNAIAAYYLPESYGAAVTGIESTTLIFTSSRAYRKSKNVTSAAP